MITNSSDTTKVIVMLNFYPYLLVTVGNMEPHCWRKMLILFGKHKSSNERFNSHYRVIVCNYFVHVIMYIASFKTLDVTTKPYFLFNYIKLHLLSRFIMIMGKIKIYLQLRLSPTM